MKNSLSEIIIEKCMMRLLIDSTRIKDRILTLKIKYLMSRPSVNLYYWRTWKKKRQIKITMEGCLWPLGSFANSNLLLFTELFQSLNSPHILFTLIPKWQPKAFCTCEHLRNRVHIPECLARFHIFSPRWFWNIQVK